MNVPTRNGKQITLLDLATHYSGLPRMPNNYNSAYSAEQLYDFLSTYTLTRDPGAKYEYSNLGGGLLGQVLAVRAGADYETLLKPACILREVQSVLWTCPRKSAASPGESCSA